jgi:hypothetical protein
LFFPLFLWAFSLFSLGKDSCVIQLSIEPQLHAKTVGTQQLVKKSVPRPRVSQRRRKGWKNNNNNNKKGISLCQKIWHSLINNKKKGSPLLAPRHSAIIRKQNF